MIDHPSVGRLDVVVDDWFEVIRGNRVADWLFYGASAVGDMGVIWLGAGAVRLLAGKDSRERFVRLCVVLGLESLVVNQGVKRLFSRERPDKVLVENGGLQWKRRTPRTSSFPSGHATSSMVAAALLSENSRLTPLWYVAALIVAFSRIHVREHHASDVLGGLVCGWIIGRLALRHYPVEEHEGVGDEEQNPVPTG